MTEKVVLVSGARTAVGKFGRVFKEVIMGNVISAGLGQNPARQAAIYAGLQFEIGSLTINKVCGSGLKAVMLAAQSIKAGDASIIVAGGMEDMSSVPHLIRSLRWGVKFGDVSITDTMLYDGLWDVYSGEVKMYYIAHLSLK